MKMFLVLQYDEAALHGGCFPSMSRMDLSSIRYAAEHPRCVVAQIYDEENGHRVGGWTSTARLDGIALR